MDVLLYHYNCHVTVIFPPILIIACESNCSRRMFSQFGRASCQHACEQSLL